MAKVPSFTNKVIVLLVLYQKLGLVLLRGSWQFHCSKSKSGITSSVHKNIKL
ncbi:hypothetical protein BofuT4_uP086840.1 [Botrytis cinerea T4]|uniref:Uncharacterized protein n=1 Tax=Botryotinia fuckeliana (strain T4) TaxID=999810 RepID=G2YGK7_BOTF4|nr:hypothetical protein BofuT4_uP086840.1 [Botrytis cinerea T4]